MTYNPNEQYEPSINPATGLPMVDHSGIDVGGSPYGADIYQPQWIPQPTYAPYWPPGGGDDLW